MKSNIFLSFLIIVLFSNISFGQEKQIIFYEFLTDDSIMMFFNERHRFTEKECSKYIRYIKIDSDGLMNGNFKDLNVKNNQLLGKGCYVKGKKNGVFEIFYKNGNLKCKGSYKNDKPIGKWDFFYENGQPERIIKITETDTLLLKFINKKGKVKVIEGNGKFKGYVAGNLILANGEILNGKPEGKWSSIMLPNRIYCKEKFSNGKLITGYFPNAALGGNKKYHDKSFLNKFFLPNYLTTLEEYSPQKCKDSIMYNHKSYAFDIEKFNSFLGTEIDKVIENGFYIDYLTNEKYLTIQFTVNKEGKADDFFIITGWGQEFLTPLSSLIRTHTTFSPNIKIMYFHLKLNFPGGNIYRYNFNFSRDRTFY